MFNTHTQVDCVHLAQLLSTLDSDISYLRRLKFDLQLQILWFPAEVYVRFVKPKINQRAA